MFAVEYIIGGKKYSVRVRRGGFNLFENGKRIGESDTVPTKEDVEQFLAMRRIESRLDGFLEPVIEGFEGKVKELERVAGDI
jgi:hypothetical protein